MQKMFKATIQLDLGYQEVTVQAHDSLMAQAMLEAQYGKGSVMGIPSEVREERSFVEKAVPVGKSVQWSWGQWLAFARGIAAFYLLNSLGMGWKWSLGIAVAVWLGPAVVQGIRSSR
jgi:hypothetical protein